MKKIKFGSVCSGIEAASVAWHPLGWEAAWLSEIEPFPSAVLAHHYPDVSNLGDMTTLPERILSGEVEAPDVFCGGTPCQAFSVAGLRNSLDDARGNLSLTFVGIANAIDHVRSVRSDDPAIIFWENVPGVLSTKDNAFGCFLGALAGEDDPIIPSGEKWTNAGCVYGPQRTVAWRVLDAQYFGVAQRRRRVFVVASARDNFDPTAVLFEFDGVRRDTAPSREAGKTIAPCVTNGPPFSRTGNERVEAEAMVLQPVCGQNGKDVVGTITAGFGGSKMGAPEVDAGLYIPIALQDVTPREKAQNGRGWNDDGTAYTVDTHATQGVAQPIDFRNLRFHDGDVAGTMQSKATGGYSLNYETGVMQPIPLDMRNAGRDPEKHDEMNRQGVGVGEPGDPAHTVTSAFVHAVAQPMVLMDQGGSVMNVEHDMVGTLRRETHGHEPVVMQPIIGGVDYENNAHGPDDVTGPLLKGSPTGGGRPLPAIALQSMAVRRLTPVECERLQGFPDGYTNIPWRKKDESPDGPRYKALGNSWAVPNVRWIGQRIQKEIEKNDL
jgi:DNA (cytosine-5)-methyltransferase 1